MKRVILIILVLILFLQIHSFEINEAKAEYSGKMHLSYLSKSVYIKDGKETIKLTFRVYNSSNVGVCNNVKAYLKIYNKTHTKNIGKLNPGSSSSFNFTITVPEKEYGAKTTFNLSVTSSNVSNRSVNRTIDEAAPPMINISAEEKKENSNNNGYIEPGETAVVHLDIINNSSRALINSNLSIMNPSDTIISEKIKELDLGKKFSKQIEIDIPFDDDSLKNNTNFDIYFNSKTANSNSKKNYSIPVSKPKISMNIINHYDRPGGLSSGNNNGKWEKDETIEMKIKIENNSGRKLKNIAAKLFKNDFINPVENNVEFDLNPGEEKEISLSFFIEKNGWTDANIKQKIIVSDGKAVYGLINPFLRISKKNFPMWIIYVLLGIVALGLLVFLIINMIKRSIANITQTGYANNRPTPVSRVSGIDKITNNTPHNTPVDAEQTIDQTINTLTSDMKKRYVVKKVLGEGGMGVVYLARDTKLGRDVAVKSLKEQLTMMKRQKKRFLKEARIAARLTHHNIVSIYDIVEEGVSVFLVFEYIDGKDMNFVIDDKGRLDISTIKKWGAQILDALKYAHSENVTHRDLKPGNIMISRKNDAKLLDFGVARLAADTMYSLTGATSGTPAYMAPEQHLGDSVDGRTDIYGFGATLYEMITGEIPFSGADQLVQKERKKYKPLDSFGLEISSTLIEIVHKCLEPGKEDRWDSAETILNKWHGI